MFLKSKLAYHYMKFGIREPQARCASGCTAGACKRLFSLGALSKEEQGSDTRKVAHQSSAQHPYAVEAADCPSIACNPYEINSMISHLLTYQ